jgi:hypothetical protein
VHSLTRGRFLGSLIAFVAILPVAARLTACSSHGAASKSDATPPADAPKGGRPASVNVLTHHNDSFRSGSNASETCLTPSVVPSLRQVGQFAMQGQVYGQPLILTGTRDLLIAASTANQLAAFDLSTMQQAWQLGPETFGTPGNVVTNIQGPLGILSTPVIDPATQNLYAVARSCATATTIDACPWTLHVVDATTGKHIDSVELTASFTNAGGVATPFDPDLHWNRPALLFQNGQIVVAFEVGQNSTQPERVQRFHGWVFTYSAANIHSPPITFVTTPNGLGGGIWQGGGGPAGDGTAVYFLTGNSIFLPRPGAPSDTPATPRDHENSAIRLDFSNGAVAATGYYDSRPYHSDGNVFQYLNFWDYDFASSGVALIPQSNDLVFGSKGGIVYLVDRTTMKQEQEPLSPFTVSPLPANETLHIAYGDLGPVVTGVPVVWSRANDSVVFMWPYGDHLTAFDYKASPASLTVMATSTDVSPSGAFMSLSSSGADVGSAVLWANVPTGSPIIGTAANLQARDPQKLTILWQTALPGYVKWACPTVSGGRVYVPTWTMSGGASILVYGTPTCGD